MSLKMNLNRSTINLRRQDPSTQDSELKDHKSKNKFKWMSWILLILIVIDGACVGPFFLKLDCNNLLKSSWRLIITSILLIPFVLNEYYHNEVESSKYTKANLLNKKTLAKMVLASFGNSMWTTAFVYSLQYTAVSHAALLGNCHALMIVLYKAIKREKLTSYEIIGTLLGFAGAGIVVNDNTADAKSLASLEAIPVWQRLVFGELLAFSGSIAATVFFLISREIRNEYPLYFRIFLMAVFGAINMTIMSIFMEGSTISFDPYNGIFGLFTHERFAFMLFLGVVIGLGVFVLYVVIIKLMDPLIVSVALFFEPVVSAMLVWGLGMQAFPGWITWVGTIILIPGMAMISFGQNKPEKGGKEEIENGEEMRTRNDTTMEEMRLRNDTTVDCEAGMLEP